MSSHEKCGATGKDRFLTKEDAKNFVGGHAAQFGSRRVYRCPFCDSYHTTKQTRARPQKKGRR